MIFIHPMWDSENQRLGLKACTPFGYFLHEVADGIGFIGLLLFVATPVFLAYRAFAHRFSWHLCWFLLVPFFVGIVGRALFEFSWRLAAKKQFHYDDQNGTAHWIEGDHAHTFPNTP